MLLLISLAVQKWVEPLYAHACRLQRTGVSEVLTVREVVHRGSDSSILWAWAKFLVAKGAVRAPEDVDAAIAFERLMAREHRPWSTIARWHVGEVSRTLVARSWTFDAQSSYEIGPIVVLRSWEPSF